MANLLNFKNTCYPHLEFRVFMIRTPRVYIKIGVVNKSPENHESYSNREFNASFPKLLLFVK